MQTQFYSQVSEIPEHVWTTFNKEKVYYSKPFLQAYEKCNEDIQFHYILISDSSHIQAFAITQTIQTPIKTITKNIKMATWLRKLVDGILRDMNIKVLYCGNIFLSGEYGTLLHQETDKIKSFNEIIKSVNLLAKRTKNLHALFVKDFKQESRYITDDLLKYGFSNMDVEPNMILYLNPSWETFEDYKADLKSKYRVKANKADSKSALLRTEKLEPDCIDKYASELQLLYSNTIVNSNFNAKVLNLQTYAELKRAFQDDFIIKAYIFDNKIVGFLSALCHDNQLDAHFIGINYELNKEHAIYPRILNDYVRIGIEKKCKQINLGRTASEIKSTLGAEPTTLTCYIRHKVGLFNFILKPLIKSIKIKSFKQHKPFKMDPLTAVK